MPPSAPQSHAATVTPLGETSPPDAASRKAASWQTATADRFNDSALVSNSDMRNQGETADTAAITNGNDLSSSMVASSPYGTASGGYGGMNGMYGGGMYGGGMYGGGLGGMYGGYGGGMMSPYYGMMSAGPLSGLNQFLFSVQSVIFSLGQAVQIIGMNAQGLRQLFESAMSMFDHAVETWHQMQVLEERARHSETEEDRKRRARLRALRMALVAGISYLGYKLVRRLLFPKRPARPAIGYGQTGTPGAYQSTAPYSSNSGYY